MAELVYVILDLLDVFVLLLALLLFQFSLEVGQQSAVNLVRVNLEVPFDLVDVL